MSSQFSVAKLRAATNNFSTDNVVGYGRSGLIYKANLSNGLTVAIKNYDPDRFQGFREFRAEAEVLGKLRHPNIVKLLSYQASGSVMLLVYDCDLWLRPCKLKIIRGVANGLAYLHGLEKPVIHRDITSRNVLVDSDDEPRIINFGLSRTIDKCHSLSHVSTAVAGSVPYMAPEYRSGSTKATVKGDVYSFGILMMETVIGPTRCSQYFDVSAQNRDFDLVEWVRGEKLAKIISEYFNSGYLDNALWPEYIRIALLCASENPEDRPVMNEVVQMLNQIPGQTAPPPASSSSTGKKKVWGFLRL
ncbi:leucine-rich repeat receptor protein kinase EMS1-like [Rosa rugosa]|uniref:leucine-rich repeat receptor protein kinase EMS1-like n=1 Tax=Rosa rugosa TaxID=74645 RepID=UPI002B412E9A|nr:leucine-rich repeat receptor protein kinase EMS1-like [Rosa rugosa]